MRHLWPIEDKLESAQTGKAQKTAEKAARPEWKFRGASLAIQTLRVPEAILAGPSETGKTIAALNVLDHEMRQHKNAQAAIVRKVRADMDGTVLQLFKENFVDPSGDVVIYGGEKPEFYIYPNGSRIWVGGMDKPGKVLSGARDHVYVNQAEELTLEDWETLSTRTTGRAGHVPVSMLFGDANPGGAAHWILKRPRLKLLESYHRDNPRLYTDAGELTEQGQRTMETLQALTGARRERLLLGKWFTPEGIVYSEFDTGNITDAEPDPNLPVEVSADDGYVDPRAIYFIQRTPNRILVFDEIYHSRHLAETCVKEVIERCEKNKWPRPEICIGPPESKELQIRFKQANIPYRSIPHKIVDGIAVVRRLICDANGVRVLQINRRCTKLIEEITDGYRYPQTGARRDDENPVDENNHGCDSLRYWCYSRARR